LNLTLGSVVQLVLYNTGQGGDMEDGFHHPVHLHSTHFHVVKVGYGNYNETTGILDTNNQDIACPNSALQCDDLKWANESWLNGNVPGMNLENPVFKDTVTVPVGGYVVLRFKADNPGWWVMHCHIMVHHMGGMALGIRIGEHDQMPKPPSNFPKCGVFEPVYDDEKKPGSGATFYGGGLIIQIVLVVLFSVY
jgi:FtsP/CotA-like multicopper oxidase with cupredoxin domain